MSNRFICCEGDMDRTVISTLPNASGYTLLPDKPKPCTARPAVGAARVLDRMLDLVRQNVPRVVVALDLDRDDAGKLYLRVERAVKEGGLTILGSEGRYDVDGSELRVVPVGIPSSAELCAMGIRTHAVDDYLILLLGDRETYDGVVRSNGRPAPPHATSLHVIKGAAESIRSNGIAFDTSKQVLELYRAVMQFPPSLASFAETIVRCAPDERRRAVLTPLDQAIP